MKNVEEMSVLWYGQSLAHDFGAYWATSSFIPSRKRASLSLLCFVTGLLIQNKISLCFRVRD